MKASSMQNHFDVRDTIKVPPNQTYCVGDTAYLNEPTY